MSLFLASYFSDTHNAYLQQKVPRSYLGKYFLRCLIFSGRLARPKANGARLATYYPPGGCWPLSALLSYPMSTSILQNIWNTYYYFTLHFVHMTVPVKEDCNNLVVYHYYTAMLKTINKKYINKNTLSVC